MQTRDIGKCKYFYPTHQILLNGVSFWIGVGGGGGAAPMGTTKPELWKISDGTVCVWGGGEGAPIQQW